jgi:hypothetical protein
MPLDWTTGEIATATKMDQLSAHASPTIAIALPGSPSNEDQIILTDSLAVPTYFWHLRFNSATGKWHYLGGVPAQAEVTTSENRTLATYGALTTPGPSIAVPVAGDYDVAIGFRGENEATWMSYDIGASAAVDDDGINGGSHAFRVRRKTLTAVTLTAKYKSDGSARFFRDRKMILTPVKIG